jgi:hypothetical protein
VFVAQIRKCVALVQKRTEKCTGEIDRLERNYSHAFQRAGKKTEGFSQGFTLGWYASAPLAREGGEIFGARIMVAAKMFTTFYVANHAKGKGFQNTVPAARVQPSRRDGAASVMPFRGFKPTATVISSLREACLVPPGIG